MTMDRMDPSLEIRKLLPRHLDQLASILEIREQWKDLMGIVPKILVKDCYDCSISCENPAKYNSDHVKLIETATSTLKRRGAEILLEEWGCSGRIRPAVGHLLHLLIKAELFRAADYVAEKILHQDRPQRPSQGPAAPISVNIRRPLEQELAEQHYSSSLLEDLSIGSFDNNIDHSKEGSGIPQITVTPDADETPGSPHLNGNQINQESDPDVKTDANKMTTSESSIMTTTSTVDSPNESFRESQVPKMSELLQGPEKSDIIPNMPHLSVFNQESDQEGIPNWSALNQVSDISPVVVNEKSSDSALMHISNIPNLTELISEDAKATRPSTSILTHNESISLSEKTISNIGSNETSLPNLSILIPETPRRLSLDDSTNNFKSSKSRQCTSPLPNLTLNTHLSHFSYHLLEAATNNFNEEPFRSITQLGRFLGSGAFGKVYLAANLLSSPVAVKKIILENVEVVNVDDAVTRQFINEVEVLSRYRHKNLLSLVGYSCDGCTYCLMYEYISGGTLKDRLQSVNNKLTWQERLIIAVGTAEAIKYLHTAFSSPLIHRDVKTANILLDCSNKPKLGDFGITKLLDNQTTSTCTVIGTPAYMAPEASRGDISVKWDTFSFGVVLLELLTSLPPLDKNREESDLVTHMQEYEDSIQPVLDVSIGSWESNNINYGEELYSIAKQCLQEKKKRPVMADVADHLEICYSTCAL